MAFSRMLSLSTGLFFTLLPYAAFGIDQPPEQPEEFSHEPSFEQAAEEPSAEPSPEPSAEPSPEPSPELSTGLSAAPLIVPSPVPSGSSCDADDEDNSCGHLVESEEEPPAVNLVVPDFSGSWFNHQTGALTVTLTSLTGGKAFASLTTSVHWQETDEDGNVTNHYITFNGAGSIDCADPIVELVSRDALSETSYIGSFRGTQQYYINGQLQGPAEAAEISVVFAHIETESLEHRLDARSSLGDMSQRFSRKLGTSFPAIITVPAAVTEDDGEEQE